MRVRPGLATLGGVLLLGGVVLFAGSTPFDDLRAPLAASGLLLLALAAVAGDTRLPDPLGVPGALLLASLLVSLLAVAGEGVGFLRQVRTQAGMTLDQRRDFALEDLLHFRKEELAEAQRVLPADASVLVLFNSAQNRHPAQLLAYYLRPRRLYFWQGAPFQLLDGRVLAMPDEAWLRSRGIRWALLLGGHRGLRVRVLPLEEVPRL